MSCHAAKRPQATPHGFKWQRTVNCREESRHLCPVNDEGKRNIYADRHAVLKRRDNAGAEFSRFMCRYGARPNKQRPLYQLPRGKASASNAIRLPVERGSASINLGRRRAPPLPTLASSEQSLAYGLRQFRPQARSGASEPTFRPRQSSLFSRKKKKSRSTG